MFLLRIRGVASETDIKHLLRLRQKIGDHINPNSEIFEIETMFFALNSKTIASVLTKAKATTRYTIHFHDSPSCQFNFATDMLERLL